MAATLAADVPGGHEHLGGHPGPRRVGGDRNPGVAAAVDDDLRHPQIGGHAHHHRGPPVLERLGRHHVIELAPQPRPNRDQRGHALAEGDPLPGGRFPATAGPTGSARATTGSVRIDRPDRVGPRAVQIEQPAARAAPGGDREPVDPAAATAQSAPSPAGGIGRQYPAAGSTRPSSGSPRAKWATLAAIRCAKRGARPSPRVGGVRGDDAVGARPERMAVRERLGIGDVQAGAADRTVLQGGDQRFGVHVAAAGDVHQPGSLVHGCQLAGADDALGVGGERQGQEDHQGPGQGLVQLGRRHGPSRARGRAGPGGARPSPPPRTGRAGGAAPR